MIEMNWFLTGIVFLILLAAGWLICRRKKMGKFPLIFVSAVSIYCTMLIKYTLFPIITGDFYPDMTFTGNALWNIQPVPFKTIGDMIENANWPVQIAGNLVLLLPVPVLIGWKQKKPRFGKLTGIGILCSLGIECLQLAENLIFQYPNGVVDIDDLLLNTAGVIIGAALICALHGAAGNKEVSEERASP